MKVGMLWFDGDHAMSVDDRIERASDYYHEKYGQKPNICFVNPHMLEQEGEKKCSGINVKPNSSVLRDHFWLGTWQSEEGGSESAHHPA